MNLIIPDLITLFQTAFGTTFTTYFHGRVKPEAIVQDNLPMLMVYPISERQVRSGTLRDNTEFRIGVRIVVNVKTYYDMSAGQGTQLDSLVAVENLVSERDADGDLQSDTVMGIINNNLTIDGNVLFTDDVECNWEVVEVGNNIQKVTADVTFTAFDRPNRT